MSQRESLHWLRKVAAKAGLELQIPTNPDFPSLRRGWVQAARAWRISEEEFARRVAGEFKLEVADLSKRNPQAIRFLPKSICQRFGLLPLEVTDGTIVVATADPSNTEAQKDIERNAGRRAVFRVAGPYRLGQALEAAFSANETPLSLLQRLAEEAARADFQVVTSDGRGLFTSLELEAPAVVKLSDLVLRQAVRYRASEIHLEPGIQRGRIRFRLDGVLQDLSDLPLETQARLVARLKHQALGDRGDAHTILVKDDEGETWEAHLLSTDTPHGELLTLRLVAPGRLPALSDLGLASSAALEIRRLVGQKSGLILVAGPAQSGKSTFIYAALRAMSGAKVVSLENPLELAIPGITQVEYDAGSGLSFAETLQQLLSQNPDVLHAGEIRDLATARITLRAALTGRLVLASVHAVDAVSGIRRLLDMGLAAGRLAESLSGVVSLRLLRRLCPVCSTPFDGDGASGSREAMLAQISGISPASRRVGCEACGNTGFQGQVPISEVLVLDSGIRSLLASAPSDEELDGAFRKAGVTSLMARALDRVRNGDTTLEEVERVLGVPPREAQAAPSAGPVLVVEDDLQDRLVIGAVLRNIGFEVVEAENGAAAMEILGSGARRFSLLILDLGLPGMSGREILGQVRSSLATRALPVIVLTGSPRPQDEIDLLDEGADDYVLKPVVNARLEARVRAVLRRSGFVLPGDV